jgi:hypothetical protein
MSNISMKNVVIGSVLAIAAVTSLSANAATVCSGGSAKDGASFAAGTGFVKVAFTPKCSANVFLEGTDASATLFKVGAASAKGKKIFGGSTVGGAVAAIEDCAGDPCKDTDATTGASKAPSS